MKKKYFVLLVIVLLTQTLFSQEKLPRIKATSPQVDIKVDNKLIENGWILAPEAFEKKFLKIDFIF